MRLLFLFILLIFGSSTLAQTTIAPAGAVVFAPVDGSAMNLVTRQAGTILGGEFTRGRIAEALSVSASVSVQGVKLPVPTTNDWSFSAVVLSTTQITSANTSTLHVLSRGGHGLAFVAGGALAPVGASFTTVQPPPTTWPSGFWMHFMVVKSGTDLSLDRNGTRVGRWTGPSNFATTGDLVLGANASGGQALDGLVDEAWLWDRALFTTESDLVASAYAVGSQNTGPRWGLALADGSGRVHFGDDYARPTADTWGQGTSAIQPYSRLGEGGAQQCTGMTCTGTAFLRTENERGVFRYGRPSIPPGATMTYAKPLTHVALSNSSRSLRLSATLITGATGRVGHRIGLSAGNAWTQEGTGTYASWIPQDGIGINLTQSSAEPSVNLISMVIEKYANGSATTVAQTTCNKLPANVAVPLTLEVTEGGAITAKLVNCAITGSIPTAEYHEFFVSDRNGGLSPETALLEDIFGADNVWVRSGFPAAPASSTVIESAPSTGVSGGAFTVTAKVTPAPSAGGMVRITTTQQTVCTITTTDANGRGTCTGTLATPGSYLLRAEFSGTANLAPSHSAPHAMVIAQATVTPQFDPSPNSQVEITAPIGTTQQRDINVSNGGGANAPLVLACTPGHAQFQVTTPASLAPGAAGVIRVSFTAQADSPPIVTDLVCTYTGGVATFSLRGISILGSNHVSFTPASGGVIPFNANLPQSPATLSAFAAVNSTSPASLQVYGCTVSGAGFAWFGATSTTLAAGGSGAVASVLFTPTVAGSFDGVINCQSNVGSLSWVARAVIGAPAVPAPTYVPQSGVTIPLGQIQLPATTLQFDISCNLQRIVLHYQR